MCGSCNSVLVAYSPSGLQALQMLSQKVGVRSTLMLGGFGLLQIATALYSTFGITFPAIWLGLLALNGFYLNQAVGRLFGR